jgi:hypothetical protein
MLSFHRLAFAISSAILLAGALHLTTGVRAEKQAERIDYVRSIKPILAARCYACHGALQQKSGLRLDTVAFMKKGGDGGPIIVPGKSAESLLFHHVTATNGARRMPPASEGEPLTKEQIDSIKSWLNEGAAGPADEKPEADPKEHWSFKPPVRPAVPTVRSRSRQRNPIDAFIAAEHDKHGLIPQGEADKRLLLRRVYLDLIGLPPTREEQASFLADPSPDSYEKVVDRLLASGAYGERWGRHWMDVWRYSDWWGLGAEVRNSQKHIWHWRDWIIESLNADKGYDQMLREMLAADELYPTDEDRLRATGYLARNYFKFNRNSWLEEVVEHTSKAFLGLTMNCTKCHDHKYDPISQQDFYRFRAFFEPYQVRTDMVAGTVDFEKDGLPRAFDCNLDAPTYLFVRGDERQPKKTRPLAPGLPAILSPGKLDIQPVTLPPEAHQPGLRALVLENHLRLAEQQIAAARAALEKARQALGEAEKAKNEPKKPAEVVAVKPLVSDDFGKARADWWEMKAGRWRYQDKKLLQQQEGATRAVLRLKQAVRADFQATFKFTPLGGQTWKSVGLAFDVAGGNEVLVYLSAYAGGPKLQITYRRGAEQVYPPEATQPRPVKLEEAQELTVRVRGTVVNVAVNGKHALAYRLPLPRKAGSIDLVTFDASAEFTRFELAALPAEAKLILPGGPGAKPLDRPLTVEDARLALAVAEKALDAALLEPETVKARAAADRARFAQPQAANVKELAGKAARAERLLAVAKAEEAIARAEREVSVDRTKGPARLAAGQVALAAARKAAESPGENYTSLRGSLKTVENNLESETSRNKPFPTSSSGRRTALAKWLTSNKNPLTARVAVNHIWARHFGKPLVATVFDFGRKGARPTHPELLDFLATELIEGGWSMKRLHRLMVTSNTYRLTARSAGAESSRKKDPENRWYWRMNPVRMEAEVVRDTLLFLAGGLDRTGGGPPIPANAPSTRRSLYFVHSHNDHQKFLTLFDGAGVLECYRRAESIVPQQALALQNSSAALDAAEKIARRLNARPASDGEFIRAAFEMILGCSPSAEELAECSAALAELHTLAVREKRPDPAGRARKTIVHALLNHNDFVTVR